LLVITPVRYRDGAADARVVGRATDVQAVLDDLPAAIDIEIDEIGERGFERASVTAELSERQRETVTAALELGYYDRSEQVTYDDIADRLGCAPSTAAEHLLKAEAKIVRATMAEAMYSAAESDAHNRG
jgi:predicted DNA binding protein